MASFNNDISQAKSTLSKTVDETHESTLKLTALIDEVVEVVADLKPKLEQPNITLNEHCDEDILKSAREESIEFLQKFCQIQTAEWLDTSVNASPCDIMTDFFMLRVKEFKNTNKDQPSDQITYQLILEMKTKTGEQYDIVLLTSEGGMGKTTFMKFIAQMFCLNPSAIASLSDYNICMYLECRNLGINNFDDLLKCQFPKTPKKFGMSYQEFKFFLQNQKLIILIDGFDEAHLGTKKAVAEILHMRNTKAFVTTRPASQRNASRLIPGHKNVATLQILGILPEHHEEFIYKLLCILIDDEEERRRVCFELIDELRSMVTRFGTFLNSPMILTHLTYLKVVNSDNFDMITTISEIFEALRLMKIGKVLKRLEIKLIPIEDLERAVSKFMEIYEEIAFKTYTKNEFDLSKETIDELINACQKYNLPHEELLSTFFDTRSCHEGLLVTKGYKYPHLTEQEYTYAKYLARYIIEDIMNITGIEVDNSHPSENHLQNSIIWEFLAGKMSESDLLDRKSELSQFRNIVKFLTGEITRFSLTNKKVENAFENLAGKLVHIGWLSTYEQICYDMLCGEAKGNNSSYSNSNISSKKPNQPEDDVNNDEAKGNNSSYSESHISSKKPNQPEDDVNNDEAKGNNSSYSDSNISSKNPNQPEDDVNNAVSHIDSLTISEDIKRNGNNQESVTNPVNKISTDSDIEPISETKFTRIQSDYTNRTKESDSGKKDNELIMLAESKIEVEKEVSRNSSLETSMDISQKVNVSKLESFADRDCQDSEYSFVTDTNVELIRETESTEAFNNIENIYDDSNSGREDFVLAMLTESKMDKHMENAVNEKLSTKEAWFIKNGMNFPALNISLKSTQPKQISIVIDSDPLSYPDFHWTLAMITEKQIELELYMNVHYSGQVEGLSDAWINKKSKLVDVIGRLGELGLNNLPNTLKSAHIATDVANLTCLCKKLYSLKSLDILGLQIDIGPKFDPSIIPKLTYLGTSLIVTLTAPLSDEFIPQVAEIFAKLCPKKKNGEFTSICLRNTDITSTGMHCLLENLQSLNVRVHGPIRIWSTDNISSQLKSDLNTKAKDLNFGRVYIYDNLSTAAMMPKQIVKQEDSWECIDNN
ncbi:unnamed protein product, partial [Meganyctiphanes norvegica]